MATVTEKQTRYVRVSVDQLAEMMNLDRKSAKGYLDVLVMKGVATCCGKRPANSLDDRGAPNRIYKLAKRYLLD